MIHADIAPGNVGQARRMDSPPPSPAGHGSMDLVSSAVDKEFQQAATSQDRVASTSSDVQAHVASSCTCLQPYPNATSPTTPWKPASEADFIDFVATYLQHLADVGTACLRLRAATHPTPTSTISFQSHSVPRIDLHAYLARILKYAPTSPACVLAALTYLEAINGAHVPTCPGCRWATIQQAKSLTPISSPLLGADASVDASAGQQPRVYVHAYSVHRLLLVAMVVSIKFNSDHIFANAHFASMFECA
jgi:hypothetical protein